MIIGITGKSGSGKTTVSRILNEYNEYVIINGDRLAHEVLKQEVVIEELVKRYGKDILEDGVVDRKKLGNIIFNSDKKTKEYNAFIWEYMKNQIQKQIDSTKKSIIIEWSLLPLTDYFDKCDVKILLEKDIETRKKRVIIRDNITEEYFMKRENQSIEYNEKDYDIVTNEEDVDKIKMLIERRNNMKIGLFPGSFDPFTNGHLQVVKTSAKLFDKVIIGLAENFMKNKKYDPEIMKKAIEETLIEENIQNCEVVCYDKLTVDFAKEKHAKFIIRGLRDNIDYAYEEDIAKFNYELSRIDTIYIRSNTNISSTFVNELVKYKKDISKYVPSKIRAAIENMNK